MVLSIHGRINKSGLFISSAGNKDTEIERNPISINNINCFKLLQLFWVVLILILERGSVSVSTGKEKSLLDIWIRHDRGRLP